MGRRAIDVELFLVVLCHFGLCLELSAHMSHLRGACEQRENNGPSTVAKP